MRPLAARDRQRVLSVGVVNGLLQRADLAGLRWPLSAGLYADGLHERL